MMMMTPVNFYGNTISLGITLENVLERSQHGGYVFTFAFYYFDFQHKFGGIDDCLLVEPLALVLVFIYQARQNAIYTANALLGTKCLVMNKVSIPVCFGRDKHAPAL